MDPDVTAAIGAILEHADLGPYRSLNHFTRRQNQTTFIVIGALRCKSKLTCIPAFGHYVFGLCEF